MTTRDDLERVGAEARETLLRVFLDATDDLPDDAMDGIDALLAYRDPNGNRVVILASELEQAGYFDKQGKLIAFITETTRPYREHPKAKVVPVFVLRPSFGPE